MAKFKRLPLLTKNFQQLKEEVASHIAADAVRQGSYKTCFIGCLANQSDDPQYIKNTYGIPEMVSRIAESIFENLPEGGEAPEFFGALPAAVACDGKDLSRVPWQFLAAELESLPTMPDGVQAVIDPVIAGMKLLAEGKAWGEAEAAAGAASAAMRAVMLLPRPRWAADGAADRAANAARAASAAASAAWAVESAVESAAARAAARATKSAAWAADSAADRDAVRRRQRDLLLRLISEAPVVSQEENNQ